MISGYATSEGTKNFSKNSQVHLENFKIFEDLQFQDLKFFEDLKHFSET